MEIKIRGLSSQSTTGLEKVDDEACFNAKKLKDQVLSIATWL